MGTSFSHCLSTVQINCAENQTPRAIAEASAEDHLRNLGFLTSIPQLPDRFDRDGESPRLPCVLVDGAFVLHCGGEVQHVQELGLAGVGGAPHTATAAPVPDPT